mmetsp:Transcript_3497/g.8700  ORF Transcript_3497/g.8700 Transcript_3497/m.8700 type:complete len:294 (+) Transcript_3497:1503-2384(+)
MAECAHFRETFPFAVAAKLIEVLPHVALGAPLEQYLAVRNLDAKHVPEPALASFPGEVEASHRTALACVERFQGAGIVTVDVVAAKSGVLVVAERLPVPVILAAHSVLAVALEVLVHPLPLLARRVQQLRLKRYDALLLEVTDSGQGPPFAVVVRARRVIGLFRLGVGCLEQGDTGGTRSLDRIEGDAILARGIPVHPVSAGTRSVEVLEVQDVELPVRTLQMVDQPLFGVMTTLRLLVDGSNGDVNGLQRSPERVLVGFEGVGISQEGLAVFLVPALLQPLLQPALPHGTIC